MRKKSSGSLLPISGTSSLETRGAPYRAGMVTCIGMPNVGKSSLINQLVGVPISIATPKIHTTRERIQAVLNTTSFQLVFCDTPGMLSPAHALQERMENTLKASLDGMDAIVLMGAANEQPHALIAQYLKLIETKAVDAKLICVLNKMDLCRDEEARLHALRRWEEAFGERKPLPISTRNEEGLGELLRLLMACLPEHPPYYPMKQICDKSERFLAAEIIRKHILMHYKAEVPYSAHVSVETFMEQNHCLHIHASISVERESQKGILIGAGGRALRNVGRQARKELEAFFGSKVYLRTQVKVTKNWMHDSEKLARLLANQ